MFTDNLLLNSSAEAGTLDNWVATNVTVQPGGTDGSFFFRLGPNATLSQTVVQTLFTEDTDSYYRLLADFTLSNSVGPRDTLINAYVLVYQNYFDGTCDVSKVPLVQGWSPTKDTAQGVWYSLDALLRIRASKLIDSIRIVVVTENITGFLSVDAIVLQRNVTPIEYAESLIEQLANGLYIGGTFIDERAVMSPIIAGNTGYINDEFFVGASGIALRASDKSIRAGANGYNSGNGIWMGKDSDVWKMFIGAQAGEKILWDGTNLQIVGSLTVTGGNAATVEYVDDNIAYRVEITSINGNVFKNGAISTTLVATVYRGNDDVTDILNAVSFRWTRVSADPLSDQAWNTAHFGGAKQIEVTPADMYVKATFSCDITI